MGDLGPLTGEQETAIGSIARAAGRLSSTSRSLLLLAGTATDGFTVTPVPTDLVSLVEEAARDYPLLCPAQQVTAEAEGVADLDPFWMRHLLDNLVTNAAKADARHVHIRAHGTGGTWTIQVHDDGHGIPAGEIHRVLAPMYRSSVSVDRGVPGQGLGLFVVSAVAAAHGARVRIKSSTQAPTHTAVSVARGTLGGGGG